ILVMVSNNPYVLGASLDAAERRTLESGRLGVVAVTTRTGAEAAGLMAASAVGLRRQSPSWHEFATPNFDVRSRSRTARAGGDGEALVLSTPLEFAICPRGLRLLVPVDNLDVARAREARQTRVRDVWSLAVGRPA